ncbi:MAG: class III signal peptide-containing protein [Candidatus Omnitrophota bacterium]|nr:MAG: class III signal peptide-containing protein [Candidatus Omnitrophota bacterium]
MRINHRAQTTLEYAILIAVVAAACAAMTTYVQRAVRANLKVIEEQINAEPD